MEQFVPIAIALVLIVVAWKVLKGIVKTIALIAIAGFAALYVLGALN